MVLASSLKGFLLPLCLLCFSLQLICSSAHRAVTLLRGRRRWLHLPGKDATDQVLAPALNSSKQHPTLGQCGENNIPTSQEGDEEGRACCHILREEIASGSAGRCDLLIPSQLYYHGSLLLSLSEPHQWVVWDPKVSHAPQWAVLYPMLNHPQPCPFCSWQSTDIACRQNLHLPDKYSNPYVFSPAVWARAVSVQAHERQGSHFTAARMQEWTWCCCRYK